MEGREEERPNFHELRGLGNSLLELQHLVFLLHNASRNKVSTGIFCPEGSGEEGKRSRASSVQRISTQGSDCLGSGFCREECLCIYRASQCFQVGGKCRKLFIRFFFKYSSYLSAWMHCHFCMKYSGDYLVINCLIRTGDGSCLAFNLAIEVTFREEKLLMTSSL